MQFAAIQRDQFSLGEQDKPLPRDLFMRFWRRLGGGRLYLETSSKRGDLRGTGASETPLLKNPAHTFLTNLTNASGPCVLAVMEQTFSPKLAIPSAVVQEHTFFYSKRRVVFSDHFGGKGATATHVTP